mgnify:CR=1 FL=1
MLAIAASWHERTLQATVEQRDKYDEMAEILETSVGSLKASYHHAVKKIEAMLGDD